jgi:two-component system copper resistance phosphate regulon response regulator CusR
MPADMEAAPSRILVIEDEPKVARALGDGLGAEGYAVDVAHTGEEGFYLVCSKSYDLLLLDRMLPGRDGLEILQTLRARGFLLPVLVLTARDGVSDRVAGLDAGADDYLVKPFAFPELLARVRALLRRSRGDQILRLTVADLVLDVTTREASRAGRPLELTAREFELLEYLVRHNGVIVSREMLARDVWHETRRGTPLDNVIDVHIARLRKKVDLDSEAKLIQTVRGVGFIVREGGP